MRVLAFLLLATAACAQTTFPAWVFQKKTSASSASVPVVISGQNNKVFGLDGSGNLALLTNGSGSSTLAGLGDVAITGIANEDLLRYDTNESKWLNISSETLLGAPVLALRDLADGAGALTNDGAGVLSWVSYQPLDSDLTSIAALSTQAYGRSLLTTNNAAAARYSLGLDSSATPSFTGLVVYNGGNDAVSFSIGAAISGTASLGVTNLSADRDFEFPDASGTFITTGNMTDITATGTIASGTWNGSAIGVAYGGTGSTSLTANNVLLGNGTSALQAVAPGTSGNVLTSNGTTWTSAAPAAGASPGGSGSEIQYRSGASTFGALTGSSVSGSSLTLAGVLGMPGGSAAAPAIVASGDTDTGIYWSAADTLAFATGGVIRATLGLSGGVGTMTLSTPSGSAVYSSVGGGAQLGSTSVNASLTPYWTVTAVSGNFASSNRAYTFSLGGDVTVAGDAADVWAHRRGTNPQTVRVYETDNGSNDEYLEISAASGTNYIKPAATGTGTASKLDHYVTSSVFITSGAGSPEAAVTAPVGSLFIRTDGGANTTLYVKESGSGNTGWVAK